MSVSTLVEKIEIEERSMKQQHYRPHQHAQSQEANAIKMAGKWKQKSKKNQKESKLENPKSKIENSKSFNFFNSNPNIKSNVYSNFQTKSHRIQFLLDSGASNHFVNNRNYLINFKPSTEHIAFKLTEIEWK